MSWDREKERKAGRAMGIGGCIYGIVFAVAWNVIAASIGAGVMLIFGIPFLCLMIFRLGVCLQAAKNDKANTPSRETDPWDRPAPSREQPAGDTGFCPYCGYPRKSEFDYCPKCGRKL